MQEIRAVFCKSGSAKYVSHLDLNRIMCRAVRRAGVPIWYTEGFNPHPFFTFALPLSLGCNSIYETMDFKITEDMPFDEIKNRFNPCLPEGIVITDVCSPKMKHTLIAFAKYQIEIRSEKVSAEELFKLWEEFVSQPAIMVSKKTKSKAVREFDIKETIKNITTSLDGERVLVEIILPAGCTDNVNPALLTGVFLENYCDVAPEFEMTRTAVYTSEMKTFI